MTGRIEANVGLRLTSEDVADRVLELEARMPWLMGTTISTDRIADPSIFAEKDGPSIAEKMSLRGLVWRKGENKRISGWDSLRNLLYGRVLKRTFRDMPDGSREVEHEEREPMLYFTEGCTHMIRTLPEMERDLHNIEDLDDSLEDHACLSLDTELWFNGSVQRLGDILGQGGYVLNHFGLEEPATGVQITRRNSKVVRLEFDGGVEICTPDHRWLTKKGWKEARHLTSSDELRYVDINKEDLCQSNKNFEASGTIYAEATTRERVLGFTEGSGSITTDQSLPDFMSTTRMGTSRTILSRIWNYLQQVNIFRYILQNRKIFQLQGKGCLKLSSLGRLSGTGPRKGLRGTRNNTKNIVAMLLSRRHGWFVSNAARTLRVLFGKALTPTNFALQGANPLGAGQAGLTTSKEFALFVHAPLPPTSTPEQKPVAMIDAELQWRAVQRVVELKEREDVACLYAPISHSFVLASGLVSRNCDELRYVVTSRPSTGVLLRDVMPRTQMTDGERDFAEAMQGGSVSGMENLSLPRSADTGFGVSSVRNLSLHIAR